MPTAPTAAKCGISLDVTAVSVGSSGGTGSFGISTERECQWTAQADVAWLTITAGASGQGPGTLQFSAASNADPATRTGGIVVNGSRAQVTQAAAECAFELSESSASFPKSGGTGDVEVRPSSALCSWTASSSSDWITITSGGSGRGRGSVGFSVAATTGPPRSGKLTIAGVAFDVTQSEGCTFTVAPETHSIPAAGGGGSVTVTTGDGCPWTATSNQPWIGVTSAGSGSGPGTVAFSVATSTGPGRSGTLTIAGRTVTVNQGAGCTYSLAPASASPGPAGGSDSFEVRTAPACGWTATTNANWVSITSGASGAGNGVVRYTVAANAGPRRTGTITAAGQTFTVTQGNGCSPSITPTSQTVPSGGGTVSITVTVTAGCTWTAASTAAWISVQSGASGSGNGTVQLAVAASSEAERKGTVTIAGQTFTITQTSGCAFSISPSGQSVPAIGGSGSIAVATAASCAWSASSGVQWISITSGSSGSGPGTVQFTVAPNVGPARSGPIVVGGQTFTVSQDSGCSATVNPESIEAPPAGGSHDVAVATQAECSWTAVSSAPWIVVAAGVSGAGSGTVQLRFDANPGPPRTGTVAIAGRTVTVGQACAYSIAPTSQAVPAAGGGGAIAVKAGGGCPWSAVSGVAWIAITSATSGSGDATVQFAVEPNTTGLVRSGTITVAGQTFTVEQAGS